MRRHLAGVPGVGVVSASHDTTLRLWGEGGEALGRLEGHLSLVYSAAATADGRRLCSGSEDDTLRIWDADAVGSDRALLQVRGSPQTSTWCNGRGGGGAAAERFRKATSG